MKEKKHIYNIDPLKFNKMKFYWEMTDDIYIGENSVESDNSIIFTPSIDIGSFGLYLYDWIIEIPTGSIQKNNLRCIGGYFFKDDVKYKKITIPQSIKGKIFFDTTIEIGDGAYYSEFFPFKQQIFYDNDSNWLAVGDLDAKGTSIEFASNNIAVINKTNDLVAVFVKLRFN